MSEPLLLPGLDGGNPLGFLVAVGVMRTLGDVMPDHVKLVWDHASGGWRPSLIFTEDGAGLNEPKKLADTVARLLGVPRRQPNEADIKEADRLDKAYRAIKKELGTLEKELRKTAKTHGLNGRGASDFVKSGTFALKEESAIRRQGWLNRLRAVVPSPEMGLGKTLSVTPEEMRVIERAEVAAAAPQNRIVPDLLAAFGSDASTRNGLIEYTPFCLVTGSGHQYFLETVAKLLAVVTREHLHKTLFEPWMYDDERLSLRLDPLDDRRYALMWNDPTAAGNESKTMWAANLLAYRALSMFPSFPVNGSLKTTGFDNSNRQFTWPIWTRPIPLTVIRSLLSLPSLIRRPLDRGLLHAMGIEEVYESTRIQVGAPPLVKLNFSQASVAS